MMMMNDDGQDAEWYNNHDMDVERVEKKGITHNKIHEKIPVMTVKNKQPYYEMESFEIPLFEINIYLFVGLGVRFGWMFDKNRTDSL